MDRNLALELVRVTEAGAIAASKWLGRGDKHAADGAAVDAIRNRFNAVAFKGQVVIGEGEKDEAPMLYAGELLGSWVDNPQHQNSPLVDIAIDPLECTTNCAFGRPNSMSVMAVGPEGSLLKVPGTYMYQLVVGPEAKGAIQPCNSIAGNIEDTAKALGKKLSDITVGILERERNHIYAATARRLGCRIWSYDHGSINAGLATCLPDSPIDIAISIAGAPEAVITAAGVKCFGGDICGTLQPHDEKTQKEAEVGGFLDPWNKKNLYLNDLASGDELMFIATGISNGPFLEGVSFRRGEIITHSVVMRAKTGTRRFITAHHQN